MSEDVSATMRVGITVILVAALVATVLNLMVMSNSLLSGGQSTLQSGIDSVSQQEFAGFNNVRVTGTQVQTALSLFQGRDIAIVIQTKALKGITQAGTGLNYGALLTKDGQAAAANKPEELKYDEGTKKANTNNLVTNGKETNIVGATAKTAFPVTFGSTGNIAAVQQAGDAFYRGALYSENGLVQANYETGGTTQLGNAQYILSSARFNSVLIKDNSDAIIGILFTQID
jgi:hypothetical protein